jgi:hypothetical protein
MLLASQVVGALVAGLLVFAIARGMGLTRRSATASIAVVSVTLATFLSLPGLHDAIATMLEQRRANATLSQEEGRLEPGVFAGVNDEFVSWAKERIEPGETFELLLGEQIEPDVASLDSQWILFRLAPNLGVARPTRSDWVVFYEVPPSQYRVRHFYKEVQVFEPGFAIARPTDAG